jgi:tRNA pseudouridine55 synthase
MNENGFLIINKEEGISSYDVIRNLKRILNLKSKGAGKVKIGHMGTLDPMATGVLVIALGKATKQFEKFKELRKEYMVTAFFGAKSDTYDKEGKITFCHSCEGRNLTKFIINKHLKSFLGEINQTPPIYSAVKIKGKRACDRVRSGEKVHIKPKKVNIFEFELLKLKKKKIPGKGEFLLGDFKIECGSGTYVRSLINDLGEKLGTGAFVYKLQRTKIGDFLIKNSLKLSEISKENINCHLK